MRLSVKCVFPFSSTHLYIFARAGFGDIIKVANKKRQMCLIRFISFRSSQMLRKGVYFIIV